MGIFKRIQAVASANLNAAISKAEEPDKMIGYHLSKLEAELAVTKKRTAYVMAEEKSVEDSLAKAKTEAQTLEACAKKALAQGAEDDARTLLEKQETVLKEVATLEETLTIAKANTVKMRSAYSKMKAEYDALSIKSGLIKSKVAIARTQASLHKVDYDSNESTRVAFDRMSDKADRMVAQADALETLDLQETTTEDLKAKYSTSTSVDDKLNALKAEIAK